MRVKIMVGNDIVISRKFKDEESAMNAFKKLLIPEMLGTEEPAPETTRGKVSFPLVKAVVPNYSELREKKELLDKIASISNETIQPTFVAETYRDNLAETKVPYKKFTVHKCSCGHTLYKKINLFENIIYCDSCKREIALDIVPGKYTCPNCGFMPSNTVRIGLEENTNEPDIIEVKCMVCKGPVDLFYNKEKNRYCSERTV